MGERNSEIEGVSQRQGDGQGGRETVKEEIKGGRRREKERGQTG